jgi:hypothetical protein
MSNQDSLFDRSVCCVFTQSIFRKFGIHHWLAGITVLLSIPGAILNCIYYATPTDIFNWSIAEYQHYNNIGLWLHFVSLGLTMLFTSYPFRYWSGFHDTDKWTNDSTYNSTMAYIMVPVYWFCILLVYFPVIADHGKSDISLINRCSEGIILYSISSIILWYWVVIFKPVIPNLCYATKVDLPSVYLPYDGTRQTNYEKYGCFVNFFANVGFYEQETDLIKYSIWSSFNLLIIFCFSVILMNCSFAVYYNDLTLHKWMLAISITTMVFSMIIQALIFIAFYKGRNELNQTDDRKFMSFWRIVFIIAWQVVSIILFFVYLPYGGWKIDDSFKDTSMMRNIFFIIQAVPGFVALGVGIIIGIYKGLKSLGSCSYKEGYDIKKLYNEAQSTVKGYQQVDESSEITLE